MTYKRGKWYWINEMVNSVRYRLPLQTQNWQEARKLQKEKLSEIADGKVVLGATSRQTFNAALDAYLERQKLHGAERSYRTDRQRGRCLRKTFGEIRLRRITAELTPILFT